MRCCLTSQKGDKGGGRADARKGVRTGRRAEGRLDGCPNPASYRTTFIQLLQGHRNGMLCFRTTFEKHLSKNCPKTYYCAAGIPQEVEQTSNNIERERRPRAQVLIFTPKTKIWNSHNLPSLNWVFRAARDLHYSHTGDRTTVV